MSETIYRWEEIPFSRKVYWVINVILTLTITVAVVRHGRSARISADKVETERNEAAKLTERAKKDKAAEEAKAAETARAAEVERQAFMSSVGGLASIPNLRNAARGNGYIRGKVVIIDKEDKDLDSFNYQLPATLRAEKRSEVGTVVWLEWDEILVGQYEGGGGAYVYTCKMTVIDYSIPAIVGVRRLRGTDPPQTIMVNSLSNYGVGYGDKPDIIKAIENLPRR